VVIDNYNYGSFLRTAIDSALTQTRRPVEVIVVDDGSSDGSPDIIRAYGDRIVPVLKRNGGMGSALNAGFARATGDIVFFLDADDAMHPHAVETVISLWKPGVVLAHYLMDVVDNSGIWLGLHPPPPHVLADGDVRRELLLNGSFATTLTSALAFHRSALNVVMPLDEAKFTQAADGYLVRTVAMLGLVQAIHQPLSRQCRHGQNDSEFGKDFQSLISSFHKKIKYSSNELDAVREMAVRLGLRTDPMLGNNDPAYLAHRLFSLALAPEQHPLGCERKTKLLRDYCRARLTQRDALPRRLAEIALAISASMLPARALFPLVRMKYAPGSRPSWLRIPRALRQR
jgi:hypothetical protein